MKSKLPQTRFTLAVVASVLQGDFQKYISAITEYIKIFKMGIHRYFGE